MLNVKKNKIYFIAEVGSNHSGNFQNCLKAIDSAKKSGADCIKFQLYDENTIVHPKLKTLKYIKNNNFTYQRDRFRFLKLNLEKIIKIKEYCKKKKIDLCVTPFDHRLVKKLSKYIDFFKVASGDINYIPLLKEIKKTGKKCIISTGMCTYKNIDYALKILGKSNTYILHCIASYPTNFEDCNLQNIKELKKKYKIPVGFSDHTRGIEAASNSVFFGAQIIEKHYLPTERVRRVADYSLSIKPTELEKLIKITNFNLKMIGTKKNTILKSEKYFSVNLKRSLYYACNLKKGSILIDKHINFLRPFNLKGEILENYEKVIGKKIKKTVKKNELICSKYLM
jgi:sialic acid synthase SpsE